MRGFVLRMMSERFIELLVRLEDVALTRLDRRLASFLLSRAKGEDGVLHLTHEAIASELGSAREVMSRRLKDKRPKRVKEARRRRFASISMEFSVGSWLCPCLWRDTG